MRGAWIVGVLVACGGAPPTRAPVIDPATTAALDTAVAPRDESSLVTRPSQLPPEPQLATEAEIKVVTSDVPPAPNAEKLPMVFVEPVAVTPKCDGVPHLDKGRDLLNMGAYSAALAHLERSYRCDPQPATLKILIYSACLARDYSRAKRYFPHVAPKDRDRIAQMCQPPCRM